MKSARRLLLVPTLLAHLGIATSATLQAATPSLLANAQTLGATPALAEKLPAAREFTVTTAGSVEIRLTDLAAPQALTELRAIVTRGPSAVATLSAAGTQQFAAVPGIYKVQVVGTPAPAVGPTPSAGTFDVEVRTVAGNTQLLQFAGGIDAIVTPANPAQSQFQTVLDIAQPGTYQITVNDRSFPAALTSFDLILFRQGSSGAPTLISGPCAVSACTASFTVASAGLYDLAVVATAAAPDNAGLYSLAVTSSGGAIYADTHTVGTLPAATAVTLPAAGIYTLSLNDFATPAALTALRAVVTQQAAQLGALNAAGSVALSSASAGAAKLFIHRSAASSGIYGVGLTQGTQVVLRDVRTVPEGFDAISGQGGYRFTLTTPAAGDYRLQVKDLAFPAAFSSLRAVLVQNGNQVLSVSASNVTSTVTLAAGSVYLAVLSTPATVNANSLMGLSLAPAAGGTVLLDQALGVGPLYSTQPFTVQSTGAYDVTVNDLQFPAAFTELAVAVTQGSTVVGNIFGGGTVRFNAQPGLHAVHLLARPGAAAKYATWGHEVALAPPVPTVTLSATPQSVSSQGTTSLAWSSTDATSCTATGGWTGAKATSGTETSAALTTETTFTLSCTGPGGSANRSVVVSVAAAAGGGGNGGSGGGGALGFGALIALAGWAVARRSGYARLL